MTTPTPHADPTPLAQALKEIAELQAEVERLKVAEQAHADLLAVVIQPWKRDGDGAELFKINLAWWDTSDTVERAHEMIAELVERVKTRRKGA